MKGVLYPYIVLQEEYEEEEYPNVTVVIQALLNEEGFVDWRDEPLESGEQYSLNNQDVTNNCLGEMARNEAQGNAVVLLNCNAFHFRSPIVLSVNPTGNNVSIYWYNDIRSLHQWFSDNRRPQRVYVYNPKHGDDKHPAQMIAGTTKRAAQLLTNRNDTERLLKLAVGTDINSALWYYDEANNCYTEGEENYDNIDFHKLSLLSEEK